MRETLLKASAILAGAVWLITAAFIDFSSWIIPAVNAVCLIYLFLYWRANRKTPRTKREQSEVQKGVKVSRTFYNIVLDEEGGVKG